ncbi:MAG: hypothetical protein K2N30_05905 [Clostridia bacterium]|nr:hypothetical protein [Clostridia bacterium]
MAKKKTKLSLKVLFALISALLGVVAICLMAAPAAAVKDTELAYTGAQLTFGYTRTGSITGISAEVFKFSFLNFLPYILVLAGIAFSVLTVLGKLGKIAPIVSAVCYLAAGVLFFLVIEMCSPYTAIDSKDLVDAVKDTLTLGAGAIVGGILGILSAALSAAALAVKK